jgi:hypothetical protein
VALETSLLHFMIFQIEIGKCGNMYIFENEPTIKSGLMKQRQKLERIERESKDPSH